MRLDQQNTSLDLDHHMDDSTVQHLDFIVAVAIVILLPFIVISKIALKRTKKIPRIAKFLLNCLLSFDFIANSCFLVESVVPDEVVSRFCVLFGAGFAALSYITVAMLSIDRLMAFQFPYWYLNLFAKSPNIIPRVAIGCWMSVFLLHVSHRLVLCSSEYGITSFNISTSHFEDCSFIIKWSNNSIGITVMVIIISLACYIQIFRIVKRQATQSSQQARHFIRQYKTVTVVVIYMINVVATAAVYSCVTIASLDQKYSKTTVKFVILLNGVFNSCVYVLWFKECQMELLKLFVVCMPRLKEKTDKMKHSIYFIPTVDINQITKANNEPISVA